ncbi:NAD(P)H-hydrate dehydratase [Shewanella sp. A32]|uniref:NAD(P)H-hydrate dehydratase n=1 Tax=Shewanella sp. A32 TaxID=3031327 RepID=UPI0023B9048A|nr:NAD(P)H-hydrate dehydratase [Shewanella sp. A32]MDF0535821.1 NAD(P)H-hydrate dehydratase [Shewanella sp. A32]
MAQDLSQLPSLLYTAAAVRQAEMAWVTAAEGELYQLVERAGKAAFDLLRPHLKLPQKVLVIAGQGNNGADALVCMRHLLQAGIETSLLIHPATQPTSEWQQAWQLLQDFAFDMVTLDNWPEADVIVDGLLGTGIHGELRPAVAELIAQINRSPAQVLSLDLPSGVMADTGAVAGCAVIADLTIIMGAVKQGLVTGRARHCCGELHFADIGLTPYLPPSEVMRVDRHFLAACFKARPRDSHKGQSGKVTIIGGDHGMAGAIRLAGEACLRAGAGLVTVVSRPEHQLTVNNGRPELMFHGCELVDMEVYQRLGWANVLVLGPGLGQQDWGYNLYKAVGLTDKRAVVDADALNMLSTEPQQQAHWVLTPHPGEAARLLGTDTQTVEADRFAAVKALQQKYGGTVLLKGAGTLIYDGNMLYVAPVGNPGLASGGCGDVLSGIIGALMAQGLDNCRATVAGVVVHGEAADFAARDGERGMLASDLMPWIRRLVNTE